MGVNAFEFQDERTDILPPGGNLYLRGVFDSTKKGRNVAEGTDPANSLGEIDHLYRIPFPSHHFDAAMYGAGPDPCSHDLFAVKIQPGRYGFLESDMDGADRHRVRLGAHGHSTFRRDLASCRD